MSATRPRIAILISGRGSNMRALVEACRAGDINADIACVLSNKAGAPGLDYAAAHDIPTLTISHSDYPSREAFDAAMNQALDAYRPDWLLLAGFMRILTPVFIDHFAGRIFNIHPSLLPLYPGLNTHQRALEAGDTRAGASVHLVTAELDSGPVILQGVVDVCEGDDAENLAARVLGAEHLIYPQVVKWLTQGELSIDGQRCLFRGSDIIKPGRWYNGRLTEPETH
ncbi:phosphoribosylglycinamide formyltransferase [Granulosicoccaceae sp. 1_MG-2023]|nr:phosphoribosylglycinamide formyltransferase [Granulosicoccaceae sp. 1_MG-2023]